MSPFLFYYSVNPSLSTFFYSNVHRSNVYLLKSRVNRTISFVLYCTRKQANCTRASGCRHACWPSCLNSQRSLLIFLWLCFNLAIVSMKWPDRTWSTNAGMLIWPLLQTSKHRRRVTPNTRSNYPKWPSSLLKRHNRPSFRCLWASKTKTWAFLLNMLCTKMFHQHWNLS